MNTYTEALWEVIDEALDDDEALFADVKTILFKEYTPFLTTEKAREVNILTLKTYIVEKLNQWYAWLPDTSINRIGGELALHSVQEVYWS